MCTHVTQIVLKKVTGAQKKVFFFTKKLIFLLGQALIKGQLLSEKNTFFGGTRYVSLVFSN